MSRPAVKPASRFREYFQAEVVDARPVTPHMMRVRFGGLEMRNWVSSGVPDERLTLAFPEPGQRAPVRPSVIDDSWDFGDSAVPERRAYTVRGVGDGTIDVDFVVHAGGVAAEWAVRAQPGDIAGLSLASGWYRRPREASTVLLVGDATALPAMGRIIEETPAGVRVHAVVEVPTEADVQELQSAAEVTCTWIVGAGPPSAASGLPAAVRAATPPASGWYVWVAGEAGVTRSIRNDLRDVLGVAESLMSAVGYWRADPR